MDDTTQEDRLLEEIRQECRKLKNGELHLIVKVVKGHAHTAKVEHGYRTLVGNPLSEGTAQTT